MLIEGGSDRSLEWGLALGGMGVGAAPSALKVAGQIAAHTPLEIGDALMALASIVLIALSALCYLYHRKNNKSMSDIEARIRKRTPEGSAPLKIVS